MIVVDTNVLAYLFLAGERTESAERALAKDPEWAAPLLWRSEFRNVLAVGVHQKRLALPDAQQIMGAALGLLAGREYEVESLRVLELAAASSCSAYDCEFVALAQDLKLPLVTADLQILRQFPTIARSLQDY